MKHAIVAATLCLLLPAAALAQQDQQPPASAETDTAAVAEGEAAPAEAGPRIKIISLTVQGGTFSGATFFELPKYWPRTEVAEGGNLIYSFDGQSFSLPEDQRLYAPRKEIEPGYHAGARIGFFLSRNFHIDLIASYAKSKATTTFIWDDPATVDTGPSRVNLDEVGDDAEQTLRSFLRNTGMGGALWTDENFTVYKGGGALLYDSYDFRVLGLMPTFGVGLGGVLNRFSFLADKTALYFELTGGLKYELSNSLQLQATYTATMLNFDTEELEYGKQVTYGLASLGVSWLFDVSDR